MVWVQENALKDQIILNEFDSSQVEYHIDLLRLVYFYLFFHHYSIEIIFKEVVKWLKVNSL